MKNQEFKIDTEAGIVVFCQESHGNVFISKTKVSEKDKFNIGIGQLITMKRNEIKIRKADIQSMLGVLDDCNYFAINNYGTTAQKLYSNFAQITAEKIRMSRNHIRELKEDLETLYNGTYDIKPYTEILEDHKKIRNGVKEKEDLLKRPYTVPKEIADGTHMFEIVNGSAKLKPIE